MKVFPEEICIWISDVGKADSFPIGLLQFSDTCVEQNGG
jgi:hypothetical protein